MRPIHPSHALVAQDPGPRSWFALLQTAFRHNVAGVLEDDGAADPVDHRSAIRSIHTTAVTRHLANRDRNKVPLRPAPSISASEASLPRHFRTTLCQLRSGYCSRVNTYRKTIGTSDSEICPECGIEPHTMAHIFCCPEAPTDLAVEGLWRRPVEVAQHLTSMSAFADLPALEMRDSSPLSPEPPPAVWFHRAKIWLPPQQPHNTECRRVVLILI